MELSLLPISNSEDRSGPSGVRVLARGLPPALSGAALASLLVPSSTFLLTRKGQAHDAPSSPEAPLPRRWPRLSSRLPSLPFENPLPCRVAVVLTALARGLDPSEAPRVAGLATSDHHEPFSRARARTLRPCTSTRISPPPAPTRAVGRTADQVALRHTGALAGDRSPHARFCLCLSSAPAHNTWPICSSTLCDRAWPPFCLPLFTSDGLNFSFSASPSACWTVARRRASWAQSPSMAGSGGSD